MTHLPREVYSSKFYFSLSLSLSRANRTREANPVDAPRGICVRRERFNEAHKVFNQLRRAHRDRLHICDRSRLSLAILPSRSVASFLTIKSTGPRRHEIRVWNTENRYDGDNTNFHSNVKTVVGRNRGTLCHGVNLAGRKSAVSESHLWVRFPSARAILYPTRTVLWVSHHRVTALRTAGRNNKTRYARRAGYIRER